jgi:hypothetical protein
LIEALRELLRFSASPFAFADSLKLLLAPLHLEHAPDVAPSLLLLIFRVPNVPHLNGPLGAAEDSGARGPLVFRVRLLDLLDTKLELLEPSGPRYALRA